MRRRQHPVNRQRLSFGQRAADSVGGAIGSWKFIGCQTGIIIAWIILNVTAFARHWDPYPFILLNLMFSTQAAYAAPILQLSSNRQADLDREVRDHDYSVNQEALELIRKIHVVVIGEPEDGE